MSSPREHRNAVLTLIFCTICWSIAGVATRHLERAEGFEIAFWRSLFCALFVIGALSWQHRSRWWRVLGGSGAAGIASGLMWAVMFTCFMIALAHTTVANTLVVMSVAPLLAALLARVAQGQPIAPRTWAAIALAGTGIFWMVRDGLSGDGLSGMAIAFAVPVASATNIILLKRSGSRVDLVPAVAIGALISCALTLPVAWPVSASLHDLLILAMLGFVQLGLPCMLLVRAARHLAPHEIALLALLEVVFGPLWAWLGAGEQPSVATLQGGTLVVVALVLNALVSMRLRRQLTATDV